MAEFKTGDTVTLKSGGPIMTVIKTDKESDLVTCNWFSGEEVKTHRFKSDTLGIYEEAKSTF